MKIVSEKLFEGYRFSDEPEIVYNTKSDVRKEFVKLYNEGAIPEEAFDEGFNTWFSDSISNGYLEEIDSEKLDLDSNSKSNFISMTKDQVDYLIQDMKRSSEPLSTAFDELVPPTGIADTVAGEIVRAINRISYRWNNDGDVFCIGYGIDTCGSSAAYLADIIDEDDVVEMIYGFGQSIGLMDSDLIESHYETFIQELEIAVTSYLYNHPELFTKRNTTDSREFDDSEIRQTEPKFDFEYTMTKEQEEIIEYSGISERQLVWELESWDYIETVSVLGDSIIINELSFEEYEEIENRFDEWFTSYIEELAEESGFYDQDE